MSKTVEVSRLVVCAWLRRILVTAVLAGLMASALSAQTPKALRLFASASETSSGAPAVVLRAVVDPPSAPGHIIFQDGSADLGSALLVEGQAILVTTKMGPGTRQIRAYYATTGDAPARAPSDTIRFPPETRARGGVSPASESETQRVPRQKLQVNSGAFSVGTNSIVVGSAGGTSTVLLAGSGSWTAVSNSPWLHIPAGYAAGSGNVSLPFTYDANPGLSPQVGTLTIAGTTVTVTEAGAGDVLANPVSTILSTGISLPSSAAIDSSGNVYIADVGNQAVEQWNPAAQTFQALSFYLPITNATGVAVDLQSNLYIANTGASSILEWNPATQQSNTIIGSGLNSPSAVAVDTQGNIYVADTGNNAVEQWAPGATSPTAVLNGLLNPSGVALDVLGNVYIADTGNAAIKEWNPITQQVTVLVSSGLITPMGIAVDWQGNVYVADSGLGAILEWSAATQQLNTLAATGLNGPQGLALDAFGDVYIVDTGNNAIKQLISAYVGPVSISANAVAGTTAFHVIPSTTPISVASDQSWLAIGGIASDLVNLTYTSNTTLSARVGHISVLGQQVTVTQGADAAASISKVAGDGQSVVPGQPFSASLQSLVTDSGGNAIQGISVTFSVIAGSGGASASFGSGTQSTTTTGPNGMAIVSGLVANNIPGGYSVVASIGNASVSFTLSNLLASFSTTSTVVGGSAGSGAVTLTISPASATWTAVSNTPWIHISSGSATGSGTGSVQFTYDPNTTSTVQTGTITAGGQTFTITQAPAGSVEVGTATTLISAGLNLPYGLAVDALGNLYIADTGHNAIQKWNVNTQQLGMLVSTGLSSPRGVAVDSQGNVYIADSLNNAVKEWVAASGQVTTLIGSGLSLPLGVAVDSAGNVSVADFENNALKQWNAGTQAVSTLIGAGLNGPVGVAVDSHGDVYVADLLDNAVKEWNSSNSQVTVLLVPGLSFPSAVAIDTQANAYVLDANKNSVREFSAATLQTASLFSGATDASLGVATDSLGNVYLANPATGTIQKITAGYLSIGSLSRTESAAAGIDSVSVQTVPSGLVLTATSDQNWLTAGTITNGLAPFSFQANTSVVSRTAHVLILGQPITVTQNGDVAASVTKLSGDGQSVLGGAVFPVVLQVAIKDASGGAIQGASVIFTVSPAANASFASASTITTDVNGNASAPLLTAGFTGGPLTVTASVNGVSAVFSLTILTGSLSSASLNLGSAATSSQVLLLIPAPWTATSNASWLHLASNSVSGTGNAPVQFSVDANTSTAARTGTLTIAGTTFTVVQAGSAYVAIFPVSILVNTGLKAPTGVAVDSQGNVYFADTGNNAVRKWSVSTKLVTTLVSTGLNAPSGVTVDAQGDVYFTDSGNNAVKEWIAASQTVTTLSFAGLSYPFGIGLDAAGNLYVTDMGHNALKKRTASGTVTTLIATGLSSPRGLGLDALGNVYFADTKNNAIKEWNSATGSVISLVSSGLNSPSGAAADGQGSIYIADTSNNLLKRYNLGNQQITTLSVSGLNGPTGLGVDTSGHLYFADNGNNAIKRIVPAFITLASPTQTVTAAAGAGTVTATTIPATLSLAAASDQTWLTIGSINGLIVPFTYTANTSAASRVAHVSILSQVETVTQSGDVPASVTITAGNSQSAVINTAYAIPLQVKVADAGGVPIVGATVTFTVVAGSKGTTAAFPNSATTATATTSSTGIATAPALTAKSIAGTFVVKAIATSVGAGFSLTVTSH